MERYSWDAVTTEELNPTLTRQMIHTGQMTIARIWLKKGAVVPVHSHINQQVTTLQTGALQCEMGGETIVLRGGEVLVIPPDMPHSFVALEDSMAVDLFTPQREDWIRGDDAYLR